MIETAGNALWVSPLTFVEASTPGTGGFFESANQRLSVQHISPIIDAAPALRRARRGAKAGEARLSDVANVIEDHQPLIGDAVAGGAPSLLLVIEKFPGANTLQVTRDVEQAMADMAPGLKGITIDTREYRPATFVETALRNVGWVALIGLALLVAGARPARVLAYGADRRRRGAGDAGAGGVCPVPAGHHVHDDHAARARRGRVPGDR